MADENLAVELAQLREQMKSIASNVEEIKISVSQIMSLDRTIAEMGVHNEQARKEIATIWEKMESNRRWQDDHDHESSSMRQSLQSNINVVDSKIEAVVNKGRGALWLGGVVFVVVQGILSGAVVWTFSHVAEGDSVNKVQEYRIEQLEKKIPR